MKDFVIQLSHRPGELANVTNAPKLDAWGYLGPGGVLGAEWRGGPNFALELLGRYAFTLGPAGQVAGLSLGWRYLF